ncbi:LAME_0F01288g1_1 [Lachancea meyersii CBS 8951]|uniref:non-specific serine/threonine protein kinase n=1 Tax=Lachancea meyersii CBS 8951 TaxID=1266667 RepID=A0A1G4JPQ0_9SACH|nr:LAME_0F01288g1_1 [Lachancea meyersii CBS 8951]
MADIDRWYEEDSELLSGGKFIALEVSDDDEDETGYEDEQAVQRTPTTAVLKGDAKTDAKADVRGLTTPKLVKSPESRGQNGGNTKHKRWSMISSSSKKRWSSLSFASEDRRMSPAPSSSKKRRSTASIDLLEQPVASNASDNSSSINNSNNNNANTTAENGENSYGSSRRISVSSSMQSLPRSSTSNSLRQMFGKIALQDEEKENKTGVKRFIGKMSPRRNQFRSTLGQLDANVYATLNARNSYADTASLISEMSMSSKASVSSASKWKFWKRQSESYDPSSPSASSSQSVLHSNGSLVTRRSQSSLKQKSSHSSLKKLSTHRNSVTSESISLPIPDQVSRDKLRTKLRNSTSILSMRSTVIAEEFEDFQISQLLKLCDQTEPVPIEKLIPEWSKMTKISKHVARHKDFVLKFLPLAEDEFTHNKNIRVKELELLKLFSGTPGFTQFVSCHLALIHGESTLVCKLKYAGVPLIKAKLPSWSATLNIWWQCAVILYAAETKYQFEHRDLQLDHILVDQNYNVTLCDYKLSRALNGPMIYYTRLDHPLFFQGRGDYRYEVYNTMRHWCADSWSRYDPRNNLLWLHYLGVKLLEKQNDMAHDASYSELLKLVAQVNPHRRRKPLFGRNDQIMSCGDVLRLRK